MQSLSLHSPSRSAVAPEAHLSAWCFERLPRPTLVLAADGAIARANAAARVATSEAHCLYIANGRVVAFAGAASERFDEARRRALAGRAVHVVVTMSADHGARMWHVELAPLPAAAALDAGAGETQTLLIVTLHAPVRPERGIVALARLFGLTRAEMRVLAHLAVDRTPAEIGRALGVSITTIRSHLKALFQKTGARRQPELVRLALLAAGP